MRPTTDALRGARLGSTHVGVSSDERELRVAWQRHIGTSTTADAWFDTLIGRHRAPTRHYHDVRHVRWVVHHTRELAQSADPPVIGDELDAVVAAAFFHDAVYDAMRSDNESSSARLAERALHEIGWTASVTERVAHMIEATAGHDLDEAADLATAVLVAADLAVLASEPARYGDYTRAVRHEYAHLDDETWRRGRAAFIRTTLDRTSVFPSSLALTAWERRARANLKAELAALA